MRRTLISDSSILRLDYNIPDKKQSHDSGDVSVGHRIPVSEIKPDVGRQSRQAREDTNEEWVTLLTPRN